MSLQVRTHTQLSIVIEHIQNEQNVVLLNLSPNTISNNIFKENIFLFVSKEVAVNAVKYFLLLKLRYNYKYLKISTIKATIGCFYRKKIIKKAIRELSNGISFDQKINVPTITQIYTDIINKMKNDDIKFDFDFNNTNNIKFLRKNLPKIWYNESVIRDALCMYAK